MFFLFISYNNLYAEESGDKKNMWLMVGYSYTLPEAQDINSVIGPVTLSFGGNVWRFLGLEVTFGYRWGSDLYVGEILEDVTYSEDFFSADMKPYFLLQPKFGVDTLSLRPYFGIGPSFHFVGSNTASDISKITTSLNVGFSVKAGVRAQILKYLFLGVGGEYLLHKKGQVYYNDEIHDTDLSGWTIGLEIGSIF